MMQAADTPWIARPSMSVGTASTPVGASAISNAPTMLNTKPSVMMRTRPTRSAKPPITR